MRDYLYIWNDPVTQCVVASGIEFKNLAGLLDPRTSLLLIKPDSVVGRHDSRTGFDFITSEDVGELLAEDIYSWRDFVWADYRPPSEPFSPPPLSPEEVAELLYFAHRGNPLRRIVIPGLSNRFLVHSHDDGWLLRLYYADWEKVEDLLRGVLAEKIGTLSLIDLKAGISAFWVQNGKIDVEKISWDIDGVLRRRAERLSS